MSLSAEILERWRLRAKEWSDLQNAASLLRETKNDVFSEMMSHAEGKSIAERERVVRASKEWRDYVIGMVEAEAKARRAHVHLKYEGMVFDAWRAENANNRAEKYNG